MKPDNEFMLELTAHMPCKQISVNDAPYLQRYYAGNTRDNKDVWFHRFLSGDSERHLHSHPFNCVSVMLMGRYEEERINRITKQKDIVITTPDLAGDTINAIKRACGLFNHGIYAARPTGKQILDYCPQQNTIDVFDWHRITIVAPETWTMLIIDPDRLPFWFFVNDSGEFERRPSSGRDWWENYMPRGQNVGDICT